MNDVFSKNYWAQLYKIVLAQGLDIQLFLCSIVVLIALLASKLIQRILIRRFPLGTPNGWISNKMAPELLSPALTLLALMIGIWISALLVPINKRFMTGVVRLMLAWFAVRLLLLISKRHFIAYIIGSVLLVLTVLSVTNMLTSTTVFLDEITIDTTTFHVSLLSVIKGLFTLILLFWGAGALGKTGETWIRTLHFSFNARELAIKFLRISLYFTAALMTLNQMGVNLTAFTVFGGALGVGLGFGLQKITSNFISGIILLFEKTIVAGDLIEVGNEKGWVRQMAIRHTLIETFDGREMLIPNEDLITGKVTNWTYTNTRARAEILLSVTYESDAEKVMELLLASAKQYRLCLTNPPPVCIIKEFTDRGMQFALSFWIGDVKTGLGVARSEVMLTVTRIFRDTGITFAVIK